MNPGLYIYIYLKFHPLFLNLFFIGQQVASLSLQERFPAISQSQFLITGAFIEEVPDFIRNFILVKDISHALTLHLPTSAGVKVRSTFTPAYFGSIGAR